jgi:hypothetical protein
VGTTLRDVEAAGVVLETDVEPLGPAVVADGLVDAVEALVELGEALIGPRVTAAESQVFYACADGQTRKFFVTKTRMADLRADCQGLMVQRLVR